MKRLSFGIAVVAVSIVAAAPAAAASFLTTSEGRSEAESAATTYRYRHDLDEANIARCKRQSTTRVSCVAIAKGEETATTTECTLQIEARIPAGNLFATAAITSHHCTKTPRPHLTYAEAHSAIQAAADSFAGTATAITSMSRGILSLDEVGEGSYSGRAEWERPALHPTMYEPTESCSVNVEAVMNDGNVTTSTEGFACY